MAPLPTQSTASAPVPSPAPARNAAYKTLPNPPPNPTAPTNPHASSATPDANPDSEDTQMQDAATPLTPTQQEQRPNPKKRKRKEKPHILHQSTFRKPLWTYFHLSLITPSTATSGSTSTSRNPDSISEIVNLDPLTVSSLLTPPLSAYLGLVGTSIPIDILKTYGREVWLRIPRQDARGLRASLSGWIGVCDAENVPGVVGEKGRVKVAWRVVGEGTSLGLGVGSGDGADLFGG